MTTIERTLRSNIKQAILTVLQDHAGKVSLETAIRVVQDAGFGGDITIGDIKGTQVPAPKAKSTRKTKAKAKAKAKATRKTSSTRKNIRKEFSPKLVARLLKLVEKAGDAGVRSQDLREKLKMPYNEFRILTVRLLKNGDLESRGRNRGTFYTLGTSKQQLRLVGKTAKAS